MVEPIEPFLSLDGEGFLQSAEKEEIRFEVLLTSLGCAIVHFYIPSFSIS